jgi:hypothetical protein
MKKNFILFIILMSIVLVSALIPGCSSSVSSGQAGEAGGPDTTGKARIEAETQTETVVISEPEIQADPETQTEQEAQPEDETQTEPEERAEDEGPSVDIVWLGDSLTQGSLGDDNRNENNPQAPWRVLGEISGLDVAGCGFYGHKTHDIFWLYGEYNGVKDPRITYVYWVGSNDFFDSPDNIGTVIEEIDRFNENVGITKYLVLGTTNRGDMDPNAYIGINEVFEKTYGDKYLDIMPYVEFGPDKVHLTEASYRKVAEAVWEKLKILYYPGD